jgi:cyclase
MKNKRTPGTLLMLAFMGTLVMAQERNMAPVTLEKVSESVYQILGGRGANGGLVLGDNAALVIDAKMDEKSVNQTLEAISSLTGKPVKYLVNTHSDGDHIMGNRFFPDNVTIIAHENCREDFFRENFGRPSDWGEPEFYPFTPTISFAENLDLWMGEKKIELHYFGVGHTTGDIVVYVPDDQIAFLGDQYFNTRPQLIHAHKNGNSFEHVKTLSKMLETLDAEIFLSGHSEPVGREDIQKHIQAMVERQAKVKKLIGEGKSLESTLAQFDPDEARLVTAIYDEIKEQKPSQPTSDPY